MNRWVLATWFILGGVVAGGVGGAEAASPAHIAAAINGNIILFGANGGNRITLTHAGLDGSPVTSSDGQAVAFLRTPGGSQPNNTGPRKRDVLVGTPNGHGGYAVHRFSTRPAMTSASQLDLAWRPGGHGALAWYDTHGVVWQRAGGDPQRILTIGTQDSDRYGPIVWSPNGSEIVAPIPSPQTAYAPTTLRIAIATIGGSQRTITARFPAGALGPAKSVRGSYPVGDDLAFTADGHHLLVATIHKGEGYGITGVFRVSDRGGMARLVLGSRTGVRTGNAQGTALAGSSGATRVQESPSWTSMATDPSSGAFWVSGLPGTISAGIARTCTVMQWRWLPNSSGLTYVSDCNATSVPLTFRLTLSTASLGGTRHALYSMQTKNQQAIDLAPAYRCMDCGG